jgi:hypothetical protein
MFRRLKQLLCDHFYFSYVQYEPYYISDGDEYHDRRSIHYIHICQKCGKKIESVIKWNHDDVKTGMLKRER